MLRAPYAEDQDCRTVRHEIAAPGDILVRPRRDKPAGVKTGGVRSFEIQQHQR